MANTKEAARRRCNCKRAEARPGRTQASIAREYERWTHYAGIIIGVSLGIVVFLGLIAG